MSCYQGNWDDLKSELWFLKSTYCQSGECEITTPPDLNFDSLETHPCCHPVAVHLQLRAGNGEIGILFDISDGYPQLPPGVALTSSSFSPTALAGLEEKARTLASSLCPEASLFQLVDQIIQSCADMSPHPAPPTTVADSTHTHTYSSPTECTPHTAHTTALHPLHPQCRASLEPDPERQLQQAETPPSSVGPCEVWLLALDHMRNEQRYVQVLDRWSRELLTGGWVVVAGEHSITVVLVGSRKGIREMVKRWKIEAVDVDRRGRPCRERMMRVLCQHQLPPLSLHKTGMEVVHCSREELNQWFLGNNLGWLYETVLQPTLRK